MKRLVAFVVGLLALASFESPLSSQSLTKSISLVMFVDGSDERALFAQDESLRLRLWKSGVRVCFEVLR